MLKKVFDQMADLNSDQSFSLEVSQKKKPQEQQKLDNSPSEEKLEKPKDDGQKKILNPLEIFPLLPEIKLENVEEAPQRVPEVMVERVQAPQRVFRRLLPRLFQLPTLHKVLIHSVYGPITRIEDLTFSTEKLLHMTHRGNAQPWWVGQRFNLEIFRWAHQGRLFLHISTRFVRGRPEQHRPMVRGIYHFQNPSILYHKFRHTVEFFGPSHIADRPRFQIPERRSWFEAMLSTSMVMSNRAHVRRISRYYQHVRRLINNEVFRLIRGILDDVILLRNRRFYFRSQLIHMVLGDQRFAEIDAQVREADPDWVITVERFMRVLMMCSSLPMHRRFIPVLLSFDFEEFVRVIIRLGGYDRLHGNVFNYILKRVRLDHCKRVLLENMDDFIENVIARGDALVGDVAAYIARQINGNPTYSFMHDREERRPPVPEIRRGHIGRRPSR